MFARIKAAREREEGFTLIELLVVVIIIGILAAIAIPVFLNQRESAAKSALTSDARNGAVEIETYFTANQAYPADKAALDAAVAADEINLSLSENNQVTAYTSDGQSFTYCVAADDGAAVGWGVTYKSAEGGTQDPDPNGC